MKQVVPVEYRRLRVATWCLILLCAVVRGGNENDTAPYTKERATFMGGTQTFELPDGEEFCFYQEFKETAKWLFAFRVVRGGNNDVDIEVKNMGTKAIEYQMKKKHYDHSEITIKKGLFSFCFSNKFSSFSHKSVFFILTPVHPEPLESEAGKKPVPKAQTLIETILGEIHEHLSDIAESQTEHKAQVYEGIWVAFDLNSKVNYMSVTILVCIVVIGFGQVYLLRRLFNTPKSSTIKPATNVFVSPM
ncbi:transmembrane emp24 domain-containing protein 3-like [Lineus longissimus]|uniref:transmembrane emp24 domain-containing protein 3-like n=1 Tax=Lineus longissimus TaxID=88925 RepID=UPI002B4C7859